MLEEHVQDGEKLAWRLILQEIESEALRHGNSSFEDLVVFLPAGFERLKLQVAMATNRDGHLL